MVSRPARAQVVGARRQRRPSRAGGGHGGAHVGQRRRSRATGCPRSAARACPRSRPGGRGRWPRASSGPRSGCAGAPSELVSRKVTTSMPRAGQRGHQVLGGQAGDGVGGARLGAQVLGQRGARRPSAGRTRGPSTCRPAAARPASPSGLDQRARWPGRCRPARCAGARAATTSFSPARCTTASTPSQARRGRVAVAVQVGHHLLDVQVGHRARGPARARPSPPSGGCATRPLPTYPPAPVTRTLAISRRRGLRTAGPGRRPSRNARRTRGRRRRSRAAGPARARARSASARLSRIAGRAELAGHAGLDQLLGRALGGGHDRRAAGQRLDQDHPERVVARGQAGQPRLPVALVLAVGLAQAQRASALGAPPAGAAASSALAVPGAAEPQLARPARARATSGSASSSSGTSLCEPSSAPGEQDRRPRARAGAGTKSPAADPAGHDHAVGAAVLALQVVEPGSGTCSCTRRSRATTFSTARLSRRARACQYARVGQPQVGEHGPPTAPDAGGPERGQGVVAAERVDGVEVAAQPGAGTAGGRSPPRGARRPRAGGGAARAPRRPRFACAAPRPRRSSVTS